MYNYYEKLAQFNECVADDSFGNFSDGYHTFQELYNQRAILTAVIWNDHKDIAWKSKKHFDEENDPMFEGDFIIGIDTPEGQATFHIDLAYWDFFDIQELPNAKQWDGHTPEQAIERISSLIEKEDK